jgi:hypothetical protein
MTASSYVVLGLARSRTDWFGAVARWAMSASIPVTFVKCLSAEELAAHLSSGRAVSAALLDGGLPAVDRDLLARARRGACPTLVVDRTGSGRDWVGLGAVATLPEAFTREAFLDALAAHSTPVSGPAEALRPAMPGPTGDRLARLVAVCGSGGAGTSTVAIALAQGLAGRSSGGVLLADLCLRADQAMLHDTRELFPGVQELVDAHRGGRPDVAAVQALTTQIAERGYHLLLGLRRPRFWTMIRPQAFDAALVSLREAFSAVVCDVDADFETQEGGGSVDVEERCHMAQAAVTAADVVVAVGRPGLAGLHCLIRVTGELVEAGVPAVRVLPVVNEAPRQPWRRSAIAATLADLAGPIIGEALGEVVFLPRRPVETALRDGTGLPEPLPGLLAEAYRAAHRRALSAPAARSAPPEAPVHPGTVGAWSGA